MAKKTSEAKTTAEKRPAKKASVTKAEKAKEEAAEKQTAKSRTGTSATKASKTTRKAASASKAKAAAASKAGNAAAITSLAAKAEARKKDAPADASPKAETPDRKPATAVAPAEKKADQDTPPAPRETSQSQQEVVVPLVSLQPETPPTISEPPAAEVAPQSGKRNKRRRNKQRNNNPQERPQYNQDNGNRDINIKKLCRKAWEIYSAEVAEEGIALMDDNTSREAAKRSFRIAEWFLMEESRRKHVAKQKSGESEPQAPAEGNS